MASMHANPSARRLDKFKEEIPKAIFTLHEKWSFNPETSEWHSHINLQQFVKINQCFPLASFWQHSIHDKLWWWPNEWNGYFFLFQMYSCQTSNYTEDKNLHKLFADIDFRKTSKNSMDNPYKSAKKFQLSFWFSRLILPTHRISPQKLACPLIQSISMVFKRLHEMGSCIDCSLMQGVTSLA